MLDDAPLDPQDPNFDTELSDAELDAALLQHRCTPVAQESPTKVDCDIQPLDAPIYALLSDSPKGSWLHAFSEPSPLKLPAIAEWPIFPRLDDDISTRAFFD